MFLLIDNFDSFTFNLVQAFQMLGKHPQVVRNDRPELLDLAKSPDLKTVCISPGPSHPKNAGLCLRFLELLPKDIPVFGVCLGHQILGHYAGADVEVAGRIMHGKTSPVTHDGKGMFTNMPDPFEVGRYHSLIVRAEQVPDQLIVTARATDLKGLPDQGEVMGIRYTDRPWEGVQFHPESVLTPEGMTLLANFPDNLV